MCSALVALGLIIVGHAGTVGQGGKRIVTGTAIYRERIALPAAAVFEATLEDVSRADAPASIVARTRITAPGNPPIAFTIAYDPARIEPGHRYVVRATIRVANALLFTSDTAAPLLTQGGGAKVSLMLRRASASPRAATVLDGTSWQLVRFEGGDGAVFTPDGAAKYTIDFAADGTVTARLDCNRGHGTWTSAAPGQLRFGPLALTRMACPPGSLSGRLERQWSSIRSFVLKDGHLFLSLMADGGIYELEPRPKP